MDLNKILDDVRSPRIKKVIVDSDTFNEMDDQYAIAYAIGSDRMEVIGLNAAPFHNDRSANFEDGMEKSYDEILRVLENIERPGYCPVYKGSRTRIEDDPEHGPVDSPAARAIIEAAHKYDETVYILTTGACTNVSSAVMLDPSIMEKICVIWLGGHCLDFQDLGEFNLAQDYAAGQILINSGVPLILLPACDHGTSALVTRLPDMQGIKGDSRACVFFRETLPEEFNGDYYENGWERVIWDIAAPGVIAVPHGYQFTIMAAPIFGDNYRYAFDKTRHKIIYMDKVDRDIVLADTFASIGSL
ncbi:MAG: nucleoside hydrolase [Clostridia bacterium]|nr:nucleoside hydrolase [Clostridia bacterium]